MKKKRGKHVLRVGTRAAPGVALAVSQVGRGLQPIRYFSSFRLHSSSLSLILPPSSFDLKTGLM